MPRRPRGSSATGPSDLPGEGPAPSGWVSTSPPSVPVMPVVRLLEPGDAEALEHVVEGVFDAEVRRDWAQAFLTDPSHRIVVAVEGGMIVGMATAVRYGRGEGIGMWGSLGPGRHRQRGGGSVVLGSWWPEERRGDVRVASDERHLTSGSRSAEHDPTLWRRDVSFSREPPPCTEASSPSSASYLCSP